MTTNKKHVFYADPDVETALDRARESGIPVSRLCNMALREFLHADDAPPRRRASRPRGSRGFSRPTTRS